MEEARGKIGAPIPLRADPTYHTNSNIVSNLTPLTSANESFADGRRNVDEHEEFVKAHGRPQTCSNVSANRWR
jgi:hypothetical protein